MKSNLDIIAECDRFPYTSDAKNGMYRLRITGYDTIFGYMLEKIACQFTFPKEDWEVDHDEKTVLLKGTTLDERSKMVASLLQAERERGTFEQLNGSRNEIFPVYGPDRELLVGVERSGAPLFGILAYSVQLLAYQRTPEGPKVWIARRGKLRRSFAGLFDSTVGGGLSLGENPFESMVRECWEEASSPEELVRGNAKPTGNVNHFTFSESRTGGTIGLLRPKIQFMYDMEIPEDVVPKPTAAEVPNIDEFVLLDIGGLQKALANGEFTPANGSIVIDFLIRHGYITVENEEDYIEIVARLHHKFDFPTANFKQRKKDESSPSGSEDLVRTTITHPTCDYLEPTICALFRLRKNSFQENRELPPTSGARDSKIAPRNSFSVPASIRKITRSKSMHFNGPKIVAFTSQPNLEFKRFYFYKSILLSTPRINRVDLYNIPHMSLPLNNIPAHP